jgi:hypothetical protein
MSWKLIFACLLKLCRIHQASITPTSSASAAICHSSWLATSPTMLCSACQPPPDDSSRA